ncbi:PREDICTED: THAP domain-containing protein 4-like, partial [Vollenhovia emeryi]|uniref:THAP domain-containing protein 4-like n=1 Tax=Vollenhovia emeryi TaxID=411798 RepID=UPI0005F50CE9
MGGCAAPFCNNSSTKEYVMRVFPRDPVRQAVWIKSMGCENWLPTKNSYLCEIHFEPEMWEQRADHKVKLKPNAVPTIFGYFLKKRNEMDGGTQSNEPSCSKEAIINENNADESKTLQNKMDSGTESSLSKPSCNDEIVSINA